MTKPTPADVDAAWAALQPLAVEEWEANRTYNEVAEDWRLLLHNARRGTPHAAMEACSILLQGMFAASVRASSRYAIAAHAYDVLRLRAELERESDAGARLSDPA